MNSVKVLDYTRCAIWYHLYNLKDLCNLNVKHPWRSFTFSKVAGFSKAAKMFYFQGTCKRALIVEQKFKLI